MCYNSDYYWDVIGNTLIIVYKDIWIAVQQGINTDFIYFDSHSLYVLYSYTTMVKRDYNHINLIKTYYILNGSMVSCVVVLYSFSLIRQPLYLDENTTFEVYIMNDVVGRFSYD